MGGKQLRWAPAGAVAVITAAQLIWGTSTAPAAPKAGSTNPPPKLTIQDAPLSREVKAATSFAPVVKRVAPSVVNIFSTSTVRDRGADNPFLDDPFLRRFFGEGFGRQSQPRERRAIGLGSGVIVSPDGYILTANHVVEGADSVKVGLADGNQEFDAKIIGTDPLTDIAVLKVAGTKPLPGLVIADSEKLEVGDAVLAIGNPFGVGQTVTLGIISAVGRGGMGISGYENFIQTDAAINPGNSGGALVDAEGRLIGINTAILSRSGGFQGVGFAVPINMARFVMDRLITQGKVTRGYLGINIQPLTPGLAKEFGLGEQRSGVLVGDVTARSAAEKAGVKRGDVILEVNGQRVSEPRNLQLVVAQNAPGTKVTLKILRGDDGKQPVEKTLTAVLAELPRELTGVPDSQAEPDQKGLDALDGVEVTDLTPALRRQYNIPNRVQGALVTDVDQNSNSAEAGLRSGDVVVEINRQAVHNAEEAVDLSNHATGDRILLRVWNGGRGGPGGTRYLAVDNTKRK